MKRLLFPITVFFIMTTIGCTEQGKTGMTQGLNISDMDTTVSPGESFYQYATGGWQNALNAKAANHIHHIKDLMLSRSDFRRVMDNTMIVSEKGTDYNDQIIATRAISGSYALVYIPQPKPIEIDLRYLINFPKKVSWFNPVTGQYLKVGEEYNSDVYTFTPPNTEQRDWVLVIE
jgi:hypothetical protein